MAATARPAARPACLSAVNMPRAATPPAHASSAASSQVSDGGLRDSTASMAANAGAASSQP